MTNVTIDIKGTAAQNGGYLKPSLSTLRMTMTSAAETCRHIAFMQSPISSKNSSEKEKYSGSAAETVFR